MDTPNLFLLLRKAETFRLLDLNTPYLELPPTPTQNPPETAYIPNISQAYLNHAQTKKDLYARLNAVILQNAFKKPFAEIQKDIKIRVALKYAYFNRYRFNIPFDIQNTDKYEITPNRFKLAYIPDTAEYQYITKKKRYIDLNPFQILKILYHSHKIHRPEYKESIKRLKDKKPLAEKVIKLISCYYKTIKSSKRKTTLTYLKKSADTRPKIAVYSGGFSYSVNLKKSVLKSGFIYSVVETEFKKRLLNANFLYTPKTDNTP